MDLKSAFARASRGMREEARLHFVAISSLTIAFLCLGVALLAIENLGHVADTWGRSARVTVFLRDGAPAEDVEQLRLALEGLSEVATVTHVTSAAAREDFLTDSEMGSELAALPADVFPASLEVELRTGTSAPRIDAVAERVQRFGAVEDVETYRGWFSRLESLLATGRGLAIALAVLVLICVFFVVGNTIRLAVAGRRAEIEVMKLCGATDGFVRGPFIVEGAIQGLSSSVLALAILLAVFFVLRDHIDGTLAALAGVHTTFLHPAVAVGILLSGALLGAAGSVLSLRRYLTV